MAENETRFEGNEKLIKEIISLAKTGKKKKVAEAQQLIHRLHDFESEELASRLIALVGALSKK